MSDDGNLGSLENQIRAHCSKVVESSDEAELRQLCAELRQMLSQHIDLVRVRVRALKTRELEIKKKNTTTSSSPEQLSTTGE